MQLPACKPVADGTLLERALGSSTNSIVDKRVYGRQDQPSTRCQAFRHLFQREALIVKVGNSVNANDDIECATR